MLGNRKARSKPEFSYELAHSKTNQAGVDRPEHHNPIVGEAAQALREWLQAADIAEGGCLGVCEAASALASLCRRPACVTSP